MFTVGLISKECIKTYNYDSLELAKKELKEWRNAFLNNNSVFPLGLYLMQVYKKNINNYLSK